jgi:hypothetical protein
LGKWSLEKPCKKERVGEYLKKGGETVGMRKEDFILC